MPDIASFITGTEIADPILQWITIIHKSKEQNIK